MGPIFKSLSGAFKNKPVAFVRLDFTDDRTSFAAEETAALYGVDAVFDYSQNTGVIVLVTTHDMMATETLRVNMDEEEMAGKIKAAIKEGDRSAKAKK